MNLTGNAIALFLRRLDDACADKFVLLHRLDLPEHTAHLRAEIAQNRADGERHMLRAHNHIIEVAQTDLELVALRTHHLLFFALNRKVDLDDRHRLIGLADLILRVLRKIPTHLREPLLRLLLLSGKRIHALDLLRDALLQLRQTLARIIHLAARILVDVKDLRLIVLDRIDRIRQQSAQLPLLKPLYELFIHALTAS